MQKKDGAGEGGEAKEGEDGDDDIPDLVEGENFEKGVD